MAGTLTITDMKAVAQLHDGICLSREYINKYTPLKWMCKMGHTWDADYQVITQGAWCPQCAKEEGRKEEQLEIIIEIAKERGGKCLSKEYKSNLSQLKFQCKEGHVWETTPKGIKKGNWCAVCSGCAKLSIEICIDLAKSKGGKCLSKKYVSAVTPMKWQCDKGHIWVTSTSSIRNLDTWCPSCSQKIVGQMLKNDISKYIALAKKRGGKLLSKEYINAQIPLKWKCKQGHTWQASASSIQYGHWCPSCAGLKKLTIQEMHKIARERGGKCLTDKYINNKQLLQWKCDKGHIWKASANTIKSNSWCPVCGHIHTAEKRKLDISVFKKIAEKHGGKLISKVYINIKTPLKWQCAKGHVWMTVPASVSQGKWCAICAGSKKLTIEEMRKIAKSRGGKCLSNKYINQKTKLKWQCNNGHIWMATSDSVKNRGSWCPVCFKNRKIKLTQPAKQKA